MAVRHALLGLLICLLLLASPPALQATEIFEKVGTIGGTSRFTTPDARAAAMGSAFTALAEGPAAVFWNPGALGLPTSQTWLGYSTLTSESDLSYHFPSGTVSWPGFGIGAHLTRVATDPEPATSPTHPGGDGRLFDASTDIVIIGAGIDMRRLAPGLSRRLRWGTGLAVTTHRERLGSHSDRTWDLDLGTLICWKLPYPALTLNTGYSLRNATQQELQFFEDGEQVKLLRQDRLGLALIATSLERTSFGPTVRGVVSYEHQGIFFDELTLDPGENQVGAELSLAGLVSLRFGHTVEGTYDAGFSWGIGIGMKPGEAASSCFGWQFDFADLDDAYPDARQYSFSFMACL